MVDLHEDICKKVRPRDRGGYRTQEGKVRSKGVFGKYMFHTSFVYRTTPPYFYSNLGLREWTTNTLPLLWIGETWSKETTFRHWYHLDSIPKLLFSTSRCVCRWPSHHDLVTVNTNKDHFAFRNNLFSFYTGRFQKGGPEDERFLGALCRLDGALD